MNFSYLLMHEGGEDCLFRQPKMTIENMKATSFKNASMKDWEEKATASLKGKPVESLNTHTYEKIVLKPLYTNEDVLADVAGEYPGVPDFRRGIEPLGYQSKTWHVANRLSYRTMDELQEKMNHALSSGQTAISFPVKPVLFTETEKLASFFANLANRYPVSIDAGYLQAPVLAALILANRESGSAETLYGYAAADPVAEAAAAGVLPASEEDYFKEWSGILDEANRELPELRTVLVNTAPYHNNGANAVQELAVAISTGAFLLQKLLENGWELKTALSKMVFHFAIGSQFFMETAKLRAARLLWDKTAEAFGAMAEDRKMVISAETSMFTKTVFDPYVNLLRTGNEAFAAVLGGIQYLHTGTFDEASEKADSFSERIARNTQLILKSEAHLERVADPAGGSWYIETLTKELAEKAWDLFLEIDKKGGILQALQAGWLQEELAKTAEAREKDISTRRKSIIGTNVYANLSERIDEPEDQKKERVFFPGKLFAVLDKMSAGGSMIDSMEELHSEAVFAPLNISRLAVPYENLRFQALRLQERTGSEPSVGLICLGELKKHKARADFISGMLAAGGINANRSGEVHDLSSADEYIRSHNFKQYVICGDQEDYSEFGHEFAAEMKKNHPDATLYLAGLPEQSEAEMWKAAGIEDFIHLRSDAYQILNSLLQELEVYLDAKA